jgi:hypothetical protein
MTEAVIEVVGWDATREKQLAELYSDGLSFSRIAAEVGVTRNAAIGKARRLNLPPRNRKRGNQPGSTRKPKAPLPAKRLRLRIRIIGMDDSKRIKRPVVIPGRDYTCTIYELDDTTCRYPLWQIGTPHNERFYCGRPEANMTERRPYCLRHTALCGGTR